ncbi:Uncharacterised protein [Mycobacteroides abscessus subsp. abscessus]|nr:Uncharacterised protein [Mycobacteroides abscessus subsp. abscessus]
MRGSGKSLAPSIGTLLTTHTLKMKDAFLS